LALELCFNSQSAEFLHSPCAEAPPQPDLAESLGGRRGERKKSFICTSHVVCVELYTVALRAKKYSTFSLQLRQARLRIVWDCSPSWHKGSSL
jgi:hypothetical protein